VDLDGVLNVYDGWRGPEYYHPPQPGAAQFLASLNQRGYAVVVFTVRWIPDVEQWLKEHDLAEFVSTVTNQKPAAHVYIDDRAICFQGDFESTLDLIDNFKAYWETTR
jgi:hypothetical protein